MLTSEVAVVKTHLGISVKWSQCRDTRGRFHEKSQFETSFGLSLGLKSETFVLAEFLAQIDFTKGDSAETGLKS